MLCPECQTDNETGHLYCRQCGARLINVSDGDEVSSAGGDAGDRDGGGGAAASIEGASGIFLARLSQDSSEAERYPLDGSQTVIGRNEGDIRFPNDVFLSSRHCRCYRDEGRLLLQDMDSGNGTLVRIHEPTKVNFGDTLVVGRQILRLDPVRDHIPEADAKAVTPKDSVVSDSTASRGRPLTDYVACLVSILASGTVGSRYLLDREDWVLGRDRGDIVFTRDIFASNEHAVIRFRDGQHWVEDLDSRNGTYVRIEDSVELQSGDQFMAGRQIFRLVVE